MMNHAHRWLMRSYALCSPIGLKENYSDTELDDLEALTSRFSRASDILIQHVYRTIDEIELESGGTVLDRLNRAEKRGIIDSVQQVRSIRVLRNNIAHEYVLEDLIEVFHTTLAMTPVLLDHIERAVAYCHHRYQIPEAD